LKKTLILITMSIVFSFFP